LSEVKLISPLLDGFSVGNPISEHHGVRCCPAIKENTDKKYILKIISVPATQTQMDALLLTGAYKDPAAAMDYFFKGADQENYSVAKAAYRDEIIKNNFALILIVFVLLVVGILFWEGIVRYAKKFIKLISGGFAMGGKKKGGAA